MNTTLTRLLICALTVLLLRGFPTIAAENDSPAATETKPEQVEKVEKATKGRPYPFNGKIASTDKVKMTITLEGKEKPRVLLINSKTRFVKAGKPATFEDATAGEEVGGQVVKNVDDQEVAVSMRIGPKPEKPARKEQ